MSMLSAQQRTEEQILSGEGTQVIMGGREYTIHPKKGRKWGRRFRKVVDPLVDSVSGLGGVMQKHFGKEIATLDGKDFDSLALLFSIGAGEKADEILDLVYEWEPDIAKDKEYLEENASDEEFVAAFFIIMQMVYGPFVRALGLGVEKAGQTAGTSGSSTQNGPQAQPTNQSS